MVDGWEDWRIPSTLHHIPSCVPQVVLQRYARRHIMGNSLHAIAVSGGRRDFNSNFSERIIPAPIESKPQALRMPSNSRMVRDQ
jgi:hypothetical protein